MTTPFQRQEAILRDEIVKANALLGLNQFDGITYGYIGNCDVNGNNDQRAWSVFLPHPGRVGTVNDRIGYFATGDLKGIVEARRVFNGFVQGVRLARSI